MESSSVSTANEPKVSHKGLQDHYLELTPDGNAAAAASEAKHEYRLNQTLATFCFVTTYVNW
ncbi:hypothetical protein N7478_009768 [Penicillium angulare]|uniref:uncharacterized protein n=1 Tax=Penicillium angulare TaxID=116970 RepID=UPI0025424808|nr:uncharacterized protein N7478_009768 [Penicillium angulare]KAJ5266960.1 hypothetical protein N7478_009768 [Penicillium angulare]